MSAPRPDDDAGAGDGRSGSRRRRKRRSWARRKHLGLLTTGLALLVLVAGVAVVVLTWDNGRTPVSQQARATPSVATTTGSVTPTPPATTTASTPAPTASTEDTLILGTVAAVGDSQWTVTSAAGLDITVSITPTTTFPRRNPAGSYEVGDAVAVQGSLDAGVLTASSIAPQR